MAGDASADVPGLALVSDANDEPRPDAEEPSSESIHESPGPEVPVVAGASEMHSEPAGTETESPQAPDLPSEGGSDEGVAAGASEELLAVVGEAVDVSYEVSSIQLMHFIRVTDLVPCDFNGDGRLDVLALSARVSTGYGYKGFGNGTFSEGPSFDLPFRPAAAISVGQGSSPANGAFLVSAAGVVSVFFPLTSEDPSLRSQADSFSVFRVEKSGETLFVVHKAMGEAVQLYQVTNTVAADLGRHAASETGGPAEWYAALVTWMEEDDGSLAFPLPPEGREKTTQVADLNGDTVKDLVYWEAGRLVLSLSQRGEALAKTLTYPCSGEPAVIRIADVDADGFPDLLVLDGATGVLNVYLSATGSARS